MPKHIEIKFNAPRNASAASLRALMDGITFDLLRHWNEDHAAGHVLEGTVPIGKWHLLETDPAIHRDPAVLKRSALTPEPERKPIVVGAIRAAIEALGPLDGPKLPLPIDLRLPKPTPKWGAPDIKLEGAASGRISCKKPNFGNSYGT